MGQQQLLLVILGVIIASVAFGIGFTLFKDNQIDVNRMAVQQDLEEISVHARKYFNLPKTLGGGGHSFIGLTADAAGMAKIVGPDRSNNENGVYSITSSGDDALVIIRGVGKVELEDGTFPTYDCRVRARKILIEFVN